MTVKEIEAKSVLHKHKRVDSWFLSRYGMNLYRGCTHNCVYCDGRSEQYYVGGDFGKEVSVKTNAIDVLRSELDPKRKRTPFKLAYVMIGGGVGDSYQPVEENYQLSRKALQLICEKNFPVHVLTKSTLVTKDIDLLKKINEKRRAIVSFSFSSVDDIISADYEPGVPPPSERLETLDWFRKEGIATGMFLLPVLPFITDTARLMEEAVKRACDVGVDFIIFGGMTLKDGRQQKYYYKALKKHHPELLPRYETIYTGRKWGEATSEYYGVINRTFGEIAKKYGVPVRIPPVLYRDILDQNDLVVVTLDSIDYLMKLEGRSSPYGYAAHSISKLKEPLSMMRGDLQKLKGVGKTTEGIILEILSTGRSAFYERLLFGPGCGSSIKNV